MAVTRDGNWWFIQTRGKELEDKEHQQNLNKVALKIITTSKIAPGSAQFCEVQVDEDDPGRIRTLFVEGQRRGHENQTHQIVLCLIATRGNICIINTPDQEIEYKTQRVIARGIPAIMITAEDMDCRKNSDKERKEKAFTFNNLENVVNLKISTEDKEQLLKLLNEYRDCIAGDISEFGTTTQSEMGIRLQDPISVVYRPYRISYLERQELQKQIEELKKLKITRDSTSPYASPVMLVKKKNNEQRLVVDFRQLNSRTIKNKFPLPVIEDLLGSLQNMHYFTTLDCAAGFWQIPVVPDSVYKIAFVTNAGHYEWLKMPMGLSNGPAVFQKRVKILGPLINTTALVYIDDVLLPSATIQEGIQKLKDTLAALRLGNMKL